MSNTEKKPGIYTKALSNRKIIMFSLIFLIIPILFALGFMISLYSDNKPNPFADYEYKTTTLNHITENKFVINDFYFDKFAVEDEDGGLENAKIEIDINLGKKIDQNIIGSSITVKSHIVYNWANVSTAQLSRTISFNSNTSISTSNFDASFDKKPFFFKTIDLQKDARIITMFSWKETINNEEIEVNYLVELDFDDLYVSGTTLLQ